MPVRLGQFYALVLLLLCLAINVAFFSEVRENFLGDDDPLVSAHSAFSELDIAAKIAAFYPAIQSNVEDVLDEAPLEPALPEEPPVSKEESPAPKIESPALWEQHWQPIELSEDVPLVPLEPAIEPKEESKDEPKPVVPVDIPLELQQTTVLMPVPQPVAVAVQPLVADQFKPIVTELKPLVPVRHSSAPTWGTIEQQ